MNKTIILLVRKENNNYGIEELMWNIILSLLTGSFVVEYVTIVYRLEQTQVGF